MALNGSVDDFPITDIVELAHRHRKTGTLTITGMYSKAFVVFREGQIAWADATNQKLGTLMVRAGVIDQEQMTAALEAQTAGSELRFGDLLVEQGAITQEDLDAFILLQVREAVFRVMLLTTGDYEFKTGVTATEATLETPIDPHMMLMDAVRMIDEWPELQRTVRGIGGVLCQADGAHDSVQRAETDSADDDAVSQDEPGVFLLSGAQTRVWDLVDGERTVQQIVDQSRLGTFLAFKCIATLLGQGVIEGQASELAQSQGT